MHGHFEQQIPDSPLASEPVVPAITATECVCFGGPLGAGCGTCHHRKKLIRDFQRETGVPVADEACGERACESCGQVFSQRDGTRSLCATCAETTEG